MAKRTRSVHRKSTAAYRVASAEGNRTRRFLPKDAAAVTTEVKRLTTSIRNSQRDANA